MPDDTTTMTDPGATIVNGVACPVLAEPARYMNPQAALWLPDGSIRAILALVVIGADIVSQCLYQWAPPTLDTMAAMAFAFYFGQAVGKK